jgi:hypothetical protein
VAHKPLVGAGQASDVRGGTLALMDRGPSSIIGTLHVGHAFGDKRGLSYKENSSDGAKEISSPSLQNPRL